MIREIPYSQVQNSLKTGDVVLFHGIQRTSHLIELIEWSYWSHVGMVVLPQDMGLTGSEPLFWESTSSGDGIVDVISGVPKENGPMLIPLSQRINVDVTQQFDTHFKVKYLNRQLTDTEKETLKSFIYKAHDCGFPSDADMLKYFLEGKHSNVPAPDNVYFCSELVAKSFMEIGLLSSSYVPNGYCPNDFDEFKDIPALQLFYLIDGARLK